ncbi:MAG: hypothetical protein MK033_12610 [Candidatus Caenarcaniphilales bacterium]|nr:hypothetical protein [Candidatus Caenarcaniphilales bacterium]
MNNLELKLGFSNSGIIQSNEHLANDAEDSINANIEKQIEELLLNPDKANQSNSELDEVIKKTDSLAAKLQKSPGSINVINANANFDSLVSEALSLEEDERAAKGITDSELSAPEVIDQTKQKVQELSSNTKENESELNNVLDGIIEGKYEDNFDSKKQIINQLKSTYNLNIPEPNQDNADEIMEIAILEANDKENLENNNKEKELVLQ